MPVYPVLSPVVPTLPALTTLSAALAGVRQLLRYQASGFTAAAEYLYDRWQRQLLFADVLRERGNQYLEHSRSGKPPVLAFDYEIIMDGRALPDPANYALARIHPPTDCPATDPAKRPFVVIDPRAGHGPGIGGFKIDSGIGIAMRQGHPCYFVMFFPTPEPGQTIESVAKAEYAFLSRVNAMHPEASAPLVIGNCQGGWALMMLAAAAPRVVGPILLAGSPISYWAGVRGKNPMRYTGGLMGGTWLASLVGDLGNGRFDGAYLVNNFELLNPANTFWSKSYNLFARVDEERERFLEFERWWGGHFLLNREEMDWITQNLFVGNRLTAGEIVSSSGKTRIDLRNIRSPIIVFASWGDNITPPQQALNWIPDLYDSVEDIRLNEQTIVYCLHEKIGHLGIFVSGAVARKETDKLVGTLELIDILPPGLYEAVIEDTQPDMAGREYVQGRFHVRFEPRNISDILALDDGRDDERAFEVVKRVSEINQGLYDTFVSPWLKLASNEFLAETLRNLNPARFERLWFSDANPLLWPLGPIAGLIQHKRVPAAEDNPFVALEHKISEGIEHVLDSYRDARDLMQEQVFTTIYEAPLVRALSGLGNNTVSRRREQAHSWMEDEFRNLQRRVLAEDFESGTALDGLVRTIFYTKPDMLGFDERPFNLLRQELQHAGLSATGAVADLKHTLKRQALLFLLDEDRTLAGLSALLPTAELRRLALDTAYSLARARGDLGDTFQQRYKRVAEQFGLPPAPLLLEERPAHTLPADTPAPRRRTRQKRDA
ncbi:3-hydroxyalkanoate synthetase [Azoarcus sp. DD4]|nr:3-hydroxyalkanoate synthetase [Azoarcus sp. DD4]